MKRFGRLAFVLVLVLALAAAAACGQQPTGGDGNAEQGPSGPATSEEKVTLKIGSVGVPHAEILRDVVAPALAEQGIELEILEFSDYTQLNPALVEGELIANYFQHIPYLDQFNKDRGTDLQVLAKVHIEPMGLYSDKITDLAELADGARVALPNDPTNGGRALLLLQSAGLIQLTEGADYNVTKRDIVANPKNLEIVEVAAELIPNTVADVDVAAINTNYVLEANEAGKLKNPEPLYIEGSDSPYANVLVSRPEDVDNEALQALAEALVSPEVKQYIVENYEGAVVPAQELVIN